MIGFVVHAEHINVYTTAVVAGAAVAAATFFYVYSKPIAKVPGPWYTNWTGLVYVYKTLVDQGPCYLLDLHAKYGPTVRVSPTFVAISELDDLKQVYNTKETFVKSSYYNAFGNPAMPRNLFSTSSIELHRRYRRLLGGAMSESSLKPLTPEVHLRAHRAVDRMEEEMKTRGAADIAKWLLFFTTDTIGDLTFGEGFNMLSEGKPNQYSDDLHSLAKTVSVATMLPGLIQLSRKLPFALKRANEIRQSIARMNDYARQSIARQKAGDSVTLFSKIIKAEQEGVMTENELVANASGYLIAGTDTTANTLTFLIWAVCQNTDIRSKLVAEVAALPEDFTDADLKPLKYLDCVCQEALRLYPAAPSTLPRVVPPTGATLGGYVLSPGTEVGAQAYTMHRNEDVFPEPLKFNPSRWENATKEMKDTFTSFGRGNRVCIGMHLASMEMRLLVTLFFRRFPNAKMSSLEGMSNEDMIPTASFLSSPTGGRCLVEA